MAPLASSCNRLEGRTMSAVIRVDSLNKTFARKQALFNLKLEI